MLEVVDLGTVTGFQSGLSGAKTEPAIFMW
jgi:hypothetical protein